MPSDGNASEGTAGCAAAQPEGRKLIVGQAATGTESQGRRRQAEGKGEQQQHGQEDGGKRDEGSKERARQVLILGDMDAPMGARP